MKEIPVGNFYSGVKRVFGSAKTIVGSAIVAGTGFRDSGSQTETKTKKKNMEAAEEKSGVQNSYVTIVMGKKAPKKVNRGTKFQYVEGRSKSVTGSVGKQDASTLFAYGTVQQFYLGAATSNAPLMTESGVKLMDLNPYRITSGSDVFPTVSNPTSDNMFWKSLTLEMDLMNMTNVPAFVDLYFCTPKDNLESTETPSTVWGGALATDSLGIANEGAPAAASTAAAPGAIVNTHIGARPNNHRGFNQQWKILKVKKVTLASSSQERVVVSVKVNKMIYLEKIRTTDSTFVKNTSVVVMAVTRGGLVADTTDSYVGPTYSRTRVGFLTNARYVFNPVNGTAARINTIAGQQLYPMGTAVANQTNINAGDVVEAVKEIL